MKIRGTTINTPIARSAVVKDAVVSDKPWSSKNTVDKLCPAFTESGYIVACEPVEGYPLQVTSVFSEGATTITRCGKNLFDFTQTPYRVTYVSTSGSNVTRWGFAIYLPAGTYTLHAKEKVESEIEYFLYGTVMNADGTRQESCNLRSGTTDLDPPTVTIAPGDYILIYDGQNGQQSQAKTLFDAFNVQVELGNTATDFEPFSGETFELTKGNFFSTATVPALPGVNTIWADKGEVTVSGRADPNATIQHLVDKVNDLSATITALTGV